jgi:hypothetical protein
MAVNSCGHGGQGVLMKKDGVGEFYVCQNCVPIYIGKGWYVVGN